MEHHYDCHVDDRNGFIIQATGPWCQRRADSNPRTWDHDIFVQPLSQCRWPGMNETKEDQKGGITVQLTSCFTGLESTVWQLTIFVLIFKTDNSKLVKQEVNGTVILPPLVFPAET